MMSYDCPSTVCHKKGEYIYIWRYEEIGDDRLYLGVLHDVFLVLALMYLFLWVVYVRGRKLCFMFLYLSLFLVSHIVHLIIDLYL